MGWQWVPHYTVLLTMAAALSAALALYAWRHRAVPGAMIFVLLTLAVVEWSLTYALELASADLPTKVLMDKFEFLGANVVPTAWLLLVLQYTGREKWLTPRNLVLLSVEPLITLLLAWTNDLHGLIWADIWLDISGPILDLGLTPGVGFWAHTFYSYLLLLLGVLLLIRSFAHAPRLYRGQVASLLISAFIPWLGNVVWILRLTSFPQFDLTPFGFTVAGVVIAWGLFRFQLLDLVPVARGAVIENMGDGVIVLDAQSRVVDFNPAAQRIVGRTASQAIGQPVAQVFSDWPGLVEQERDATAARGEIVLGEGEEQRTFDPRISPLYDRHRRLTGRLIVLRDVTERKRAEEALRKAHDELEMRVQERTSQLARVNQELQAGILENARLFAAVQVELAERKRAEERVTISLQEKEVLLREIHHRVKNNLQVISSLLKLQSGYIQDAQALESLKDSQNRIRSMALIHEKLYRSENLAQINFGEYIRELAVFLFRSHKAEAQGIRLSVETDPVLLSIDTGMPCGLILNELVSNALRHAFPDGRPGEVRIKLGAGNDGQLSLTIADDGVGFPAELDFRKTGSLGLQLVNTLVDQLNGTIAMQSQGGTEFRIVFPKS